jgi:hypothetical protein
MTVPNSRGGAVAAAVLNGTPSRARQALEHAHRPSRLEDAGRETANVVEKRIQTLVQTNRSVAQAVRDHARALHWSALNSGELKPLLLPEVNAARVGRPNWLPQRGFTGVVVDSRLRGTSAGRRPFKRIP